MPYVNYIFVIKLCVISTNGIALRIWFITIIWWHISAKRYERAIMSNLDRLIACMVFNAVFNSISVTSTPHNILSKPLAAFPRSHCRNNGQR